MKQIMITSNTRKGENVFHCWNASLSFYVYTQNGKRGTDAAYSDISKHPNITMSIAHCAPKKEITGYYK
jgi:hypothetical protein